MDYGGRLAQQASPIIINDASIVRPHLMHMKLMKLDLEEEKKNLVLDYLMKIAPTLHSGNFENKYTNAADSIMTSFTYAHKNAVEISNLDPDIASRDAAYSATVLISAFARFVERIAINLEEAYGTTIEDSQRVAVQSLVDAKVQFGITTSFPEIEKQLRALNPVDVKEQEGTITENGRTPDPELVQSHPYMYRASRMYFFTTDQIRSMILNNPDFYRQRASAVHPGVWRTQYLLSLVDLF
jgi:hypothetical protein